MRKFFLIFYFFLFVAFPSEIGAVEGIDALLYRSSSIHPLQSKHIGQYLGQIGFGFGAASMLSCVCDKYGMCFSFGCLSLGSFLLSPLAEEVFNPNYKINISNIYRFKKLLPCGLSGFACLAVGFKAMKDL